MSNQVEAGNGIAGRHRSHRRELVSMLLPHVNVPWDLKAVTHALGQLVALAH